MALTTIPAGRSTRVERGKLAQEYRGDPRYGLQPHRRGRWLGPTLNFRGLDNPIYYLLDSDQRHYRNFTGCGNTLNCNHPVVRD